MRARSGAARALVRAQAGARGQDDTRRDRLEGQEQHGAPAVAPVADGAREGWLFAVRLTIACSWQMAAAAHLCVRAVGEARYQHARTRVGECRTSWASRSCHLP